MDNKSDGLDKDKDKEDRISGLPDSTLSHILSFLPTKYAVATSILSKRWKFVWTSISNLWFDDRLCLEYERTDYLTDNAFTMFENFVNRVLVLSHPVNIDKFSLHCFYLRYFACLNFWVFTAIMRNVREIELIIERTRILEFFELPECICTSKTLEALKLNLCFFIKIPSSSSGIFFPSLKFLHVEIHNLEDNLTEILSSNCPVLEDLSIMVHLYGGALATFNISSHTLKRLTLAFEQTDELVDTEHHVVIMATNLEHLYITDYPPVSYMVHKLNSFTKVFVNFQPARFTYSDQPAQHVVQFLEGIKNVKFLSLTVDTLFVLGWAGIDFFPTFPKLTCLELEDVNYGWRFLPIILSNTPNLDSLVLGKDIFYEYEWTEPHFLPDCLISHVKTIEMRGFEGKKNEMKRIQYLLNNGEALNTLIIRCKKTWFQKVDLNLKDQLYQKLLMFERGSRTCKVKIL